MARNKHLALVLALAATIQVASADEQLDKIIAGKATFSTVEQIQAFEDRLQEISKKVVPCTVGIRIGGASGSGVIIDKEGHILTAGHVSGAAKQKALIILHDGTRLEAVTLGANRNIDSGLMKITSKLEEPLPFVEMGDSKKLQRGQWCIATGHPGGYSPGRTPPVRCGRILGSDILTVRTDCTLIGGDSGGPLFDFEGRVIGINSRIGGFLNQNVHVPVQTYKSTWDRLVKGEVWGNRIGTNRSSRPRRPTRLPDLKPGDPVIGVIEKLNSDKAIVARVDADSPAAKAGIKANDVIKKIGNKSVSNFNELMGLVRGKKPGETIEIEVLRDKKPVKLKLKIAAYKK